MYDGPLRTFHVDLYQAGILHLFAPENGTERRRINLTLDFKTALYSLVFDNSCLTHFVFRTTKNLQHGVRVVHRHIHRAHVFSVIESEIAL